MNYEYFTALFLSNQALDDEKGGPKALAVEKLLVTRRDGRRAAYADHHGPSGRRVLALRRSVSAATLHILRRR